ncbi:DUF6701 domain-containing protein [Vibrio breoganii]|uniref:DUF6701 domain-containing protein n=1 Tax=Vibrio breoganii TaxID=553239 RepID=UPI001F52DD50|nr:DUF6701 domain-containing protein [Vibrio breoganii]
MNKFCLTILFILNISFSAKVFAIVDECNVNGAQDFSVGFVVDYIDQSEGILQSVYFTQGGNERDTLWYTLSENLDASYVFNEQWLTGGQRYYIWVDYIRGKGQNPDLAYYYIWDESANSYVLRGVAPDPIQYPTPNPKEASIKTGQLDGVNIETDFTYCGAPILPPDPPPSGGDYYIDYIPQNQIGLTCDAPLDVTFQVYNSDGSTKVDYTGGITVTSSSPTALFNGTDPSGTVYDPDNQGELALTLSDSVVNDVVVTATLDNAENDSGQYKFVARLFRFAENVNNTSDFVAGLEVQNIAVQPLECDEDGDVAVSDDYTGTHAVYFFATNHKSPDSANLNRESYVQVNSNSLNSPQTINLDFGTDSTAYIDVKYDEAGIVDYRIEDEICLKDDSGEVTEECVTTTGTHNLNVRPWTFALCEPNNSDISGTSESGDFFKRSGESFGLDAVPIRWVSDGETDPATPIEVSAFCNQLDSIETKNFYPDSAPTVNVILEAELHSPHIPIITPDCMDDYDDCLRSPDIGTIGDGLEAEPPEVLEEGIANNAKTSGPVQFSSLKWREAGSITVTASLKDQAHYLFEPINPGYRSVGRFSPNHLAMLDEDSDPEELWTQWDYADGHGGFAYMKQEFPHIFKVQAQANDNTPTLNYGLFNNTFVSNLDYVANTKDQTVDVSLLDRLSVLTFSWSGEDWPKSLLSDPSTLVVTIHDFAFAKKAEDSIGGNEVTDPDGPFDSDNSVFGIEVSTIVDGVDFDTLDIPELNEDTNTGKSFPNQPEFRYGRMNLDDVGGNTAQTLRVPLRVEYWDGSSFVTNQEDSGSLFDATQSYCVQTIWNNLPNGADTSAGLVSDGERQVSDGASDELSATHNLAAGSSNERAQVRLWLRQGSDSPQRTETGVDCTSNGSSFTNQPWLHYNWRNKGDEDPSAVVTFGTFRGNDRIIFKGERGLIGN